MPADQKLMWAGYKRGRAVVDLKTFSDYMTGVMQDASSVVLYESDPRKNTAREKSNVYVNSHKADETATTTTTQLKTTRSRALTLCQICLYGHGRRACRISSKCNVNGCQFKHHPLLHGKATTPVTQLANINTNRPQDSGVLFRILPVTLYGKSGQVNTFAFLDEGSSLTLVEGGLVAQLGIAGDSQPLFLRWTGNTSREEKNSKTVTIIVSGLDPQCHYQLVNARTVQNLDLPMQSFDVERATKRFAHLRQLPIQSYHNARPAILIGFFAVEESGVRQLGDCLSAEEQRAQEMLEKTTKRIGRHYETGLLWTEEEIELPDSYGMALQRHQCLQRRMDRNPALRENISRQIKEYVEKGYAHRATPAELESANPRKAWFLPLGAVTNPNKPGKVRLIWDAAAKASGVSLNSVLLKGPDQLTLLPAVLFRFRLYYFAVSADIEQMFHQLGIIQDDKNSLRFLWSDTADGPVQIYLMDVATFGATCSPASAQYVKNVNAQEHIKQYPRAVEGILKSHYVDDYLDSFGTETERVLTKLGEPAVIDSKNLNLDCGEQVDCVLGKLWTSSSDELSFPTRMSDEITNLLHHDTRPTKRQVLRCVMSLFDPLGLLAPFIIHEKCLSKNCGELERSGMKQCYFPRATKDTYEDAQLHVFFDASEIAYSCAAYIRTTVGDCVLVSGKSKVAPLKPMSIPRLELQACVLGARLLKFVQDNHPVVFSKRFLWTDSSTARSWIRSDPRRDKPFVAHRVGEIFEITDVKLNPADESTKWGRGPYFHPDSQWFNGPDFLRLPEEKWPQMTGTVEVTTEDAGPSVLFHFAMEPVLDFERFSTWKRMLRTTAYVLRFFFNISKPEQKRCGSLTQATLLDAERTIMKLVQRESYPDETAVLEQRDSQQNGHGSIDRNSKLYQLMPAVDENGLLRPQSRVAAARELEFDARFPLILPPKHRAMRILVEDYHRRYRHANNETVVNELRQRFTISSLRQLVKSVVYKCQLCKIRKARSSNPPMAAFPPARLAMHYRPFTYVGLDYFGPFLTKVGRSNVKRWIALFTCITVRSVHLEVAYSLSKASCISCVRRFVGRRGSPMEIFSDNGTNFQGAERILREQIDKELSVTFTSTTTKWSFIPPGAQHMGALGKGWYGLSSRL
ncbi:uncharacterized protein LOC129773987 [Toxorhynchites rutilus septentrionalis]|uniref:uncharacterized protein LOC129773987 n=1 Tax=Toxorhynchites rutilus septentrionalis TaxID=329112 RepID=UPI00247AF539|nr:uncharacterized protein LOC129773987 [Toxorhynchites rutilus septentrionalis]